MRYPRYVRLRSVLRSDTSELKIRTAANRVTCIDELTDELISHASVVLSDPITNLGKFTTGAA